LIIKKQKNIENLINAKNKSNSDLKIDISLNVFKMNENHVKDFCREWDEKADRLQIHPRIYLERGSVPKEMKRTKSCFEAWRGNLIVALDGVIVPCCVDYESLCRLGNANN